MSECVVRMEMPKRCKECKNPLCIWCDDGGDFIWDHIIAAVQDFREENDDGFPDCCPIVCQLPEGHGRLVDAELVKEILKPVDSISHYEPEWTWGELHESNCVAIDNAPTIVPATNTPTNTPTDTPTVPAERSDT